MDLSGVTRGGVVVPRRVGQVWPPGPTMQQARSARFRRTSPAMYVPAGVDPGSLEQRIVEAVGALPAYGGVTGWAALAWAGGRWFRGERYDGSRRPVTLATGDRSIRPDSALGYEISEERLALGELTAMDGLPVTELERSVAFEMRYARSLPESVLAADMAYFSDLTSPVQMAAYTARLNGWTGIPRCREALAYASENAWSPAEVRMRLAWQIEAGLGRPLDNRPVFDRDGRLIGVPDLIDPVAGVIGEYDSALHLATGRRGKDANRDEAYRQAGLEVVVMYGLRRPEIDGFLHRLRGGYARAQGSSGRWTLEMPPGWVDTTTVAARRAARAAGRYDVLWWQAG